jgi:hypothetical protein
MTILTSTLRNGGDVFILCQPIQVKYLAALTKDQLAGKKGVNEKDQVLQKHVVLSRAHRGDSTSPYILNATLPYAYSAPIM